MATRCRITSKLEIFCKGRMWPQKVITMHPYRQASCSFPCVAIRFGVCPLIQCCSNEAFCLAVGLWPARPGSPHHFFSTKNRRLAFLWLFTPSLTRFAVVCQLKLYRFGESEQPTGTVHLRSRSERQRNSYKLCSIKFISTRRANNEAHPGGQTCKHCVCLFSLLA